MKKNWLIGSAVGGMIIAGSAALAATAGHGPMRFGPDANKDGNLTKAELIASLDKHFAEVDANNDGKITKEEREAVRKGRFDRHFKAMDKDGNGQISKDEMQAAHEARKGMRGGPGDMRGPGHDGPGHDGPGMRHGGGHRGGGFGGGFGRGMEKADANKDGVLTKEEVHAGALEKFARVDTDKDGVITKAERDAAFSSMMKHSQNDKKTPAK